MKAPLILFATLAIAIVYREVALSLRYNARSTRAKARLSDCELELLLSHAHKQCLCCAEVNAPDVVYCGTCGAHCDVSISPPLLLYSGEDGYSFGYRLGSAARSKEQ